MDYDFEEDELQWLVDGDEDIEDASIATILTKGVQELGISLGIRCPEGVDSVEIVLTKSDLLKILEVIKENE